MTTARATRGKATKNVEKVSVSLAPEELRWARAEARRRRTSLSGIMAEAVREHRRALARARLLERLGKDDISASDVSAVRAEWT